MDGEFSPQIAVSLDLIQKLVYQILRFSGEAERLGRGFADLGKNQNLPK
jgi:hypothetical protein